MGRPKERWGLTILVFLAIVGIFLFLLFKDGRTVVSDELVLSARRDKTGFGGVLYNYHPVRSESASTSSIDPRRETVPETYFESPEMGEGRPAVEGEISPTRRIPGKTSAGGGSMGKDKIPGFIYHKVQSGDSLWKIAKRYNADIGDIVKYNSIRDPNVIFAGATLKIAPRLS
jgi:hypothetical protein